MNIDEEKTIINTFKIPKLLEGYSLWAEYDRKSTNRKNLQQNSIKHQLHNNKNTSERKKVMIHTQIIEKRSAKIKNTREWFNKLIKLCKTWKIDYIICDEPKRLSRNAGDSAKIIELMDARLIKWILCTSREYMSDNSSDKLILQLDLALSKKDNEDRGEDTKNKMITAFKGWICVYKAPIWYINIFVKKWDNKVLIDKKIWPIIKKWFELRIQGYSYSKIADFFYDKWIKTKSWRKFAVERVRTILNDKFYMWIMTWCGMESKWKYTPLVTKEIYYKAIKQNKPYTITNKNRIYRFSWTIKGSDWLHMYWYTQKGNIYYKSSSNSKLVVNISEKLIFEQFWVILKDFQLNESLWEIALYNIKDIYSKADKERSKNREVLKKDIEKLKQRKSILVDKFLDGSIPENLYKEKLLDIECNISEKNQELQPQYKISEKIIKKLEKYVELFKKLYQSHSQLNQEEKLNILKSLNVELLINTKKELHIAESRLMQLLKKVGFHVWYPRQESNLHLPLRRGLFYPLNYKD